MESNELEKAQAAAKAAQLKAARIASRNDASASRNKEKIVDALCQMAVNGAPPHRLAEAAAGLAAAISAIAL